MKSNFANRPRRFLLRLWQASLVITLACAFHLPPAFARPFDGGLSSNGGRQRAQRLTAQDEAFLEDLSRRSFQFFWEQADPATGLVLDRARTDGAPSSENRRHFASIAATGFGLTALCIAAERRWIEPKEARERVRKTLRFFADRSYHDHGWFYHFVDARTGERWGRSEISTIDTALLLGGVLSARQYFRGDAESASRC